MGTGQTPSVDKDKIKSFRRATKWTLRWHSLIKSNVVFLFQDTSWKVIWSAFQKVAMWSPALDPFSQVGRHVESITKAPFTDVPLPAFLEQDRKCNVERRAWLCSSSTLMETGLLKISMWGFKKAGDAGWLIREDPGPIWCGFVCSGPSKSHCSTFQVFHMSQSWSSPPPLPPPAGRSAPHNLPPAGSDWSYWLPTHWAHQLNLVIITPWLCVDINLSEIIKRSMSWCCSKVIGELLRMAISPLKTNISVKQHFFSVCIWLQMENEASSKHINQWFVLPVYFSLLKHIPFAPNHEPLQQVSTSRNCQKDHGSLNVLYFFPSISDLKCHKMQMAKCGRQY